MDVPSQPSFAFVFARWPWHPIPDCPGRYVLRGAGTTLEPLDVVGATAKVLEFSSPVTPDAVLVVRFTGGGLLTFRKPDGRLFVHTLNTPEGLARRLAKLGIAL